MSKIETPSRGVTTATLEKAGDGRALEVHELGSPDEAARTIVFCHAAPGAGTFDPDPAATIARNVRVLSIDRPGYGRSDPPSDGTWASVDRAADDIADALRQRGIDNVGAAGWSAGGRVALALAARHPDLVERVAVIATPAPDDEVPWVPPEQRASLEALRGKPARDVHTALGGMMAALVPLDPTAQNAVDLVGISPVDAPVLDREGVRERLADMVAEAFAQGATGMAADIAGYAIRPWGFEPGDVHQKTLLIYGAKDALTGSAHGRWWQQHLPDARLEMVPDAGHLVVVPMWSRVLSFLAPTR